MTQVGQMTARSKEMNLHSSPFIRIFDVIITGISLPLLLPLFITLALIIKLTSQGPIIEETLCISKDGRLFRKYKFCTTGLQSKRPSEAEHETPISRFLRWSHLASLPQLLNVLRGEMAFIGPQPVTPDTISQYSAEQQQLLAVRPGIISPAQLYFWDKRTLLNQDEWRTFYREQVLTRRADVNLAYLRQRTLWTDLSLLLHTSITVLTGGTRINSLLELRNRHYFVLDLLALLLTPAIVLTILHNGFHWRSQSVPALLLYTAVSLSIKLAIFYSLGLYRRYWAYASVNDLATVFGAVTLATTVLTLLTAYTHELLAVHALALVQTVPLIDGLLTGMVVSSFRFGSRGLYHWHRRYQSLIGGRRILIVGAGEAGVMTVREMQANPRLGMEPVLFVDDDPAKVGTRIQGLPVLGTSNDIPRLVALYQIQRIIIAVPSAPLNRRRDIMDICEKTNVKTHNLPGMYELLAGHKTISRLPAFDINQLLRREPVVTDTSGVAVLLTGKIVLVTGAGGSIGSELCRQIARCQPAAIVLLGRGENSIFEIGLDLRLSFPGLIIHQAIIDVRDAERLNHVVEKYRPQIIFHAAAHKHVPFMEANVGEAVTNNVLGTRNVLRAAQQQSVDRFVLISTDKAINPVNVMGVTKRIAELLTQAVAQRTGRAYLAVRFGNVLGSRGSVVPVFQQQIAAGGPITVTHPDMSRYFMTIPEAVQLVLQAAALGEQGTVYVLDMGEPVRILDLATDLIHLSGLEVGRDIEIIHTGARPGEKLSEELFFEQESYQRTRYPKIFSAAGERMLDVEQLEAAIDRLADLAKTVDDQALICQMRLIVPEYKPGTEQQPASIIQTPVPSTRIVHPQPLHSGA